MQTRHAHVDNDAHTYARQPVGSRRMEIADPPIVRRPSPGVDDVDELVTAGRAARARAEELEAAARAERDQLGTVIQKLRRGHRLPLRVVAELMGYASDNSVRQKTTGTAATALPGSGMTEGPTL
jgi:hypothetical protein